MPNRIIALDFDGVICNSIKECYVTSLKAYAKMRNLDPYILKLKADFETFSEIRYLVRPAKEYFILIDWLYQNPQKKLDLATFKNIRSKFEDELNHFEYYFFAQRNHAQTSSIQDWLQLHTIYEEFSDFWLGLNEEGEVFIVTTKDETSVQLLLKHAGVLMDSQRIWGKERGEDKLNLLQRISREENIELSQIHFVDDNIEHVDHVDSGGVHSYYASWGYSPENTEMPNDRIISVGSLNEFKQKMKQY